MGGTRLDFMPFCFHSCVSFCLALPTDPTSVWSARCQWLLPAGPAAVLQPAATAPAPAAPGTVPVTGPAEVPGSAGKHCPTTDSHPRAGSVKGTPVQQTKPTPHLFEGAVLIK